MQAVGRASRACVRIALLAAGLLSPATASHAEPPMRPADTPEPPRFVAGKLRVTSPPHAAGSVFLHWEGVIAAPMASQLSEAFEAFKSSRRRVVLVLNTGGGSVVEGEKVIALLRRIKETHTLDTSVGPGARCGSMCLPIYLQGQARFGARSSTWLFHEITRRGHQYGKLKRVEASGRRLIESYWVPAGVSRAWLDRMLEETDNHDWWQTGADLINANAGIITRPIDNRRPRNLEIEQSMPAAVRSARARPGQAPSSLPATPPSDNLPPWSPPPASATSPQSAGPPVGMPAPPGGRP